MEQQRKRQRRITIAIGAVIALLVVGIIGGAVFLSNQKKAESGVVADPSAALPTGVFDAAAQWPYGVPTGSDPKAPVVEIWEDMQCPACAAFEAQMGQTLKAKADAGEIYLVNRPTTFLDTNLNTTYSRLATAAYGCAIDAGKGYDYKEAVLSNQPAKEGDGWTEEQLVGFASQVGIEGEALTTFESCLTDRTYVPWAGNSTQEFIAAGIGGTPTILIAGKQVPTADVLDPEKFQQLIDEAAAAQ
jgi:protein-disulfide isomerase